MNTDQLLIEASLEGNLEVVKFLVEHGADIHDFAFRIASDHGYLDIVKYLVSKGADIHAERGYAIRRASKFGHLEIVKFLVSKGVDIHAQDDEAVRWASMCGHLEVVKYLESVSIKELTMSELEKVFSEEDDIKEGYKEGYEILRAEIKKQGLWEYFSPDIREN